MTLISISSSQQRLKIVVTIQTVPVSRCGLQRTSAYRAVINPLDLVGLGVILLFVEFVIMVKLSVNAQQDQGVYLRIGDAHGVQHFHYIQFKERGSKYKCLNPIDTSKYNYQKLMFLGVMVCVLYVTLNSRVNDPI